MDQNDNRKTAPVGQEIPKTPADRVRLIQEMQRAADAQPVQQQQQIAQQVAVQQQVSQTGVPDAFAVKQINAIQQALANKTTATEAQTYSKLQQSAGALFGGGSTDIEILGNPWKVIPFGDSLPALFDDAKDAQAKLPEKAVKTEHGALFEIGLMPKGAEAPAQKRAVLVNSQGKLAGAECKTPQDVSRLFANAKWLLPDTATRANTSWKVTAGVDSAFTLELERGAGAVKSTERLALNNFGQLTTQGKKGNILVANYFLDRFDAAV